MKSDLSFSSSLCLLKVHHRPESLKDGKELAGVAWGNLVGSQRLGEGISNGKQGDGSEFPACYKN